MTSQPIKVSARCYQELSRLAETSKNPRVRVNDDAVELLFEITEMMRKGYEIGYKNPNDETDRGFIKFLGLRKYLPNHIERE